jgi:hypothetical protein
MHKHRYDVLLLFSLEIHFAYTTWFRVRIQGINYAKYDDGHAVNDHLDHGIC